MQIHPVILHQNGIVSVTMQASFVGDPSDATDQQRIQAYGDPLVNLGGLFTDPASPSFQFTFPASELYAAVTTVMQNYTARFMQALPVIPPFQPNYVQYQPQPTSLSATGQGSLDCVVTDPVHAATVWAAAIEARCLAALATLRAKAPAILTSLPNATI